MKQMNDFSKILNKAKEIETNMREHQEKIKKIEVEGVSGGDRVKIKINGEGEILNIFISPDLLKEPKDLLEDLIMAAHKNAKDSLKQKTTDEISKITEGLGIPGFKWPL